MDTKIIQNKKKYQDLDQNITIIIISGYDNDTIIILISGYDNHTNISIDQVPDKNILVGAYYAVHACNVVDGD